MSAFELCFMVTIMQLYHSINKLLNNNKLIKFKVIQQRYGFALGS